MNEDQPGQTTSGALIIGGEQYIVTSALEVPITDRSDPQYGGRMTRFTLRLAEGGRRRWTTVGHAITSNSVLVPVECAYCFTEEGPFDVINLAGNMACHQVGNCQVRQAQRNGVPQVTSLEWETTTVRRHRVTLTLEEIREVFGFGGTPDEGVFSHMVAMLKWHSYPWFAKLVDSARAEDMGEQFGRVTHNWLMVDGIEHQEL
jgi:hypothetical protein